MTTIELATKLVKYHKMVETLNQKIVQLKEELLKQTQPGTVIKINSHIVEHKVIKETIKDPEMLKQLGIDLEKVTVTVTKIDPFLVKRVGEAQNVKYYTEKPVVFVKEAARQFLVPSL